MQYSKTARPSYAEFKVIPLSDSTDGRMIAIAATSTPGTDLHTGPSDTSQYDRVFMWATNIHTAALDVSIEK